MHYNSTRDFCEKGLKKNLKIDFSRRSKHLRFESLVISMILVNLTFNSQLSVLSTRIAYGWKGHGISFFKIYKVSIIAVLLNINSIELMIEILMGF